MKILYKKSMLSTLLLLLILSYSFFPSIVHAKNYYKFSMESLSNIYEESTDTTLNTISSEKNIYLTFDDGPDPKITPVILDILKKENIKVTFFVIGERVNFYKKTFNRMINEGHSIGLHSYNHILKDVYKSDSDFISQMKKCQSTIKSVSGKTPNIIRFPGGTYKRLTPTLLYKLHAKNYKIYDWHTSVEDGTKPSTPPDELVKNAISYKTKGKNIIVLLHNRPNNKTTTEALPKLIKYYKSLGYKFKTINTSTPEYYFYCK